MDPAATAPTTPAAPSAPAASSNEGASQESSFDFGALAVDDGGDPGVDTNSGEAAPSAPPAAPPSPEPSTATVPPVAAVPPAVASAPPTPPPEPQVQPPAATPPATETAPAVPELTIEQHRDKFVPQLAKLYQLTDAEVESLRVNPGEALPQLAGKLHYEVQVATYQGIMSVLPQIIAQQLQGREAYSKNETLFYGKWPALQEAVKSNPQAESVVASAIRSFRQLNPKASLEDTIAQAGLLAMMTLKLPLNLQPPPAAGNGQGGPQASVAPQVPPLAPARPPGIGASGAAPGAAAPGAEGNIFEQIAEGHLRGDF